MSRINAALLTRVSAQNLVDKIIEIISPIIWEVDENLRILETNLTMKESTLLLLYHSQSALEEVNLVRYLEHSNPTVYRRDEHEQKKGMDKIPVCWTGDSLGAHLYHISPPLFSAFELLSRPFG